MEVAGPDAPHRTLSGHLERPQRRARFGCCSTGGPGTMGRGFGPGGPSSSAPERCDPRGVRGCPRGLADTGRALVSGDGASPGCAMGTWWSELSPGSRALLRAVGTSWQGNLGTGPLLAGPVARRAPSMLQREKGEAPRLCLLLCCPLSFCPYSGLFKAGLWCPPLFLQHCSKGSPSLWKCPCQLTRGPPGVLHVGHLLHLAEPVPLPPSARPHLPGVS